MKCIHFALALLCLLPFACKRGETPVTSDTATTTLVTTSTEPETARFTEKTSFETLTATRSVATGLRVQFRGVVTHVLAEGVERAVVPRVPGHARKIFFPGSMKTDIERTFGVTCSSICEVPFDGFALQIVDASGAVGAAFDSSPKFKSIVTHLKAVPTTEKPFDAKADLNDDVFAADPKKGSVVAGYFELAGGKGDAAAWSCPAHFVGEMTYYDWPSAVNVDFKLAAGSKLQVKMAVASGSATWTDVATLTGTPTFIVDNDLPTSKVSHFDSYALLSKKTAAGTSNPVNLPDVVTDGTQCIPSFGDVPGCSNSQWP
jgi:hypothetical protein